MLRRLLVIPAGLLLITAPFTNRVIADVVYDNISASTGAVSAGDAGVSTTGSGPLGDSFSTDSSPSTLTDVQVLVSADTPTDGGAFTVSLLSDSSTSPGTTIATLGTIQDSALTTSPTETTVDVPVTSTIDLAPNTRYWIELGGATTSGNWSYDVANVGVGVASEFNFYAGGVSANNSFTPYQMTVTTTPVPEPTTLGLAGLCVAGLALRRRRA